MCSKAVVEGGDLTRYSRGSDLLSCRTGRLSDVVLGKAMGLPHAWKLAAEEDALLVQHAFAAIVPWVFRVSCNMARDWF